MARLLVDAMSGPWKPSDYRDSYTDRVNELIEAKKDKKEYQLADQAPAATNVADLSEALRASVAAAGKTGRRGQDWPPRVRLAARRLAWPPPVSGRPRLSWPPAG